MSKSPYVTEIKGKQHFERLLADTEKPVIIDFWAPWCGPCKMQGPVFEATAKELHEQVVFAKLNTEAVPALAKALNVSSIPSLLVLSQGEVVDARIGLTNKAQLVTMLQRALDKQNHVGFFAKVKRLFAGNAEATPTAPAA